VRQDLGQLKDGRFVEGLPRVQTKLSRVGQLKMNVNKQLQAAIAAAKDSNTYATRTLKQDIAHKSAQQPEKCKVSFFQSTPIASRKERKGISNPPSGSKVETKRAKSAISPLSLGSLDVAPVSILSPDASSICSLISWNDSRVISDQSLSPSAESGESPVVLSLRFGDETDLKTHQDSTFECDSIAASVPLLASSSSSASVATSVVSEPAVCSLLPASPSSDSASPSAVASSAVPPHVPSFLNHFDNALRRISATAASSPSTLAEEKEKELALYLVKKLQDEGLKKQQSEKDFYAADDESGDLLRQLQVEKSRYQ
jgi:hypothetical protein